MKYKAVLSDGEAGVVAERDPNDMRRRIINTNDIRRLQERL